MTNITLLSASLDNASSIQTLSGTYAHATFSGNSISVSKYDKYLSFPITSIDPKCGRLEFSYKPSFAWGNIVSYRRILVSAGVDGIADPKILLETFNNRIVFSINDGTISRQVSTTPGVRLWLKGKWCKITLEWDNSSDDSMKIFINDVRMDTLIGIQSGGWNINFPQNSRLHIGCLNHQVGMSGDGYIDNLISTSIEQVIVVPPPPPPNPTPLFPNDRSALGMNLLDLSDWSPEVPFVDLMKNSRAWIIGTSGQWDTGRQPVLDVNGWPTIVQNGDILRRIIVGLDSANVIMYPTGEYTVLYEGQGTFNYNGIGVQVVSRSPGRDVIRLDPTIGHNWRLDITQTTSGNHLRNIRIIMPGFEQTYQTQIFNPRWLSRIEMFKTLRFMGWMKVSSNDGGFITSWNDRARPESSTWVLTGCPVEIMVNLCNRLNCNPWFSLQHTVDDNYVRQFATYVRDNLNPNLKANVEYTNEIWNGSWPFGIQQGYCRTNGLAEGLGPDPFTATARWYARRSVQIFRIFDEVFGTNVRNRINRVISSQAANVGVSTLILNHTENGMPVRNQVDSLAIAPYFGNSLGEPQNLANTETMSIDQVMTFLNDESMNEITGWIRQQKIEARTLKLIAYEGGIHLVNQNANSIIQNLFNLANRDVRIRNIIINYLNIWRREGGEDFCYFQDVYAPGRYGYWGALETLEVITPKYTGLLEWISNNPKWF